MLLGASSSKLYKRDQPETSRRDSALKKRKKPEKEEAKLKHFHKNSQQSRKGNPNSRDANLDDEICYFMELFSVPINDDKSPPSDFDIDDSNDESEEEDSKKSNSDLYNIDEPLNAEPLSTLMPAKNGCDNLK